MNYYLAKTANNDLPVALLTTFKIIETENLTEEIGNVGALKVILLTPDGKPMNVFVVHLDPFSSETRLCEVNTLVQQMQPYIGQTTILMGDMNCYLGQQESKRLNKTGWKPVDPNWGIDQIWIAPSVNWSKPAQSKYLTVPSGLSDHRPAYAEISIFPTLETIPTFTPFPITPTISAPILVSDTLANVRVLNFDRFDELCSKVKWDSGWISEKISSGVLEVSGKEYWASGVSRRQGFSEGQGVILRFQFAKGSEFEMHFDNEKWDTDPYRRFGIYVRNNAIQSNVYQGKNDIGGKILAGNLKPEPDTWYNLMLVVGNNGEFNVLIWDPADRSRMLNYRREGMGKDWTSLSWVFNLGANKGKILLDDFTEISFSELK